MSDELESALKRARERGLEFLEKLDEAIIEAGNKVDQPIVGSKRVTMRVATARRLLAAARLVQRAKATSD